jgi:large subunit ribosomal protein L18
MSKTKSKIEKRFRVKRRIRAKITGTLERPRLAVFRSNSRIYAQIIDDTLGKTLVSASDIKNTKGSPMERSKEVGKAIADNAKKAGITTVVFDRGGFKYTGRIKQLADSAREGGLIF